MLNRYLAISMILSAAFAASPADASPCGKKATAMLRFYNTSLSNSGARPDTGGGASTNSSRIGAVPINTDQQRKASVLVQKASSEDQTGDVAGCNADLGAANAIIKYDK